MDNCHDTIDLDEPKEDNNNSKNEVDQGDDGKEELTPEQIKTLKRSILKNVVVISIAFMLLFTAFQSIANLQSSINREKGLGVASLSAIYATLVLSCMFIPSIMIEKLTVKWAIVVSMSCYSAYIAAQFHPALYTLIPGAIILGFGAAPMWSGNCTYISKLGNAYAELTNTAPESVIARFFGIFYLFFQCSSIWGNIISSTVLSVGKDTNATLDPNIDFTTCGVYFCPNVEAEKAADVDEDVQAIVEDNFKTSQSQIYTLTGVYLACSLTSAVIVAALLDPISRFGENEKSDDKAKLTGVQLLVATFKHMFNKNQILVIPLTFWCGIQQGFFGADFTAGYVACTYGVENIGYVLITYGVCDAICSLSFGAIVKYVGRKVIFALGTIINIAVIIVFFEWTPNPDEAYVLFILAGLWGSADAVWQTQVNALYGVLFESQEEAAFANYRLWEALGFILAYILQTQVCVYTKLWVLIGVLLTGMTGYTIIETLLFKKNKNKNVA